LAGTATTTINSSNHEDFIPELWASRAIASFFDAAALVRLVNRDYEDEIQTKGATIHVPKFGTMTANDKEVGKTVTLQNTEGDKVDVSLAYHKESSFIVEDILAAQSNVAVMDGYIRESAVALVTAVEAVIAAQWAYATHVVGNGSTNITEANVLSGRRKLNTSQIPKTGRVFVCQDFEKLLQIERFTEASKLGYSTIPEGLMGRIHGFGCYEDPRIAEEAGSPGILHNLMFHPAAITLATRPLPLPDPKTGVAAYYTMFENIVLRILYGYNINVLGYQITLDILFGVKTMRPECLVDFRSALLS